MVAADRAGRPGDECGRVFALGGRARPPRHASLGAGPQGRTEDRGQGAVEQFVGVVDGALPAGVGPRGRACRQPGPQPRGRPDAQLEPGRLPVAEPGGGAGVRRRRRASSGRRFWIGWPGGGSVPRVPRTPAARGPLFSRAFREYPFDAGVLYQSPVQMGPANLLYPAATHYRATMTGIPYDDLDGLARTVPGRRVCGPVRQGGRTVAAGAEASWSRRWPRPRWTARQRPGPNCVLPGQPGYTSPAWRSRPASRPRGTPWRSRRRLPRPSAKRCWLACARRSKSEARAAGELFRLAREDSCLGYEAANQYFYLPIDLMEKVVNCRWVADRLPVRTMAVQPGLGQ